MIESVSVLGILWENVSMEDVVEEGRQFSSEAGTAPDRADPEESTNQQQLLDQFVEQVRAGDSPDDLMPRVRAHLERCRDCREEYEALLDALRATE